MKFFLSIAIAFCLTTSTTPSVIGKWKTIDDNSGKAIAIVEIYENSGKVYGKVIDVFLARDKVRKCVNCSGADKNKPILGLTVIRGLTKDGDEYSGGRILDPKSGNFYKCYIEK